MGEDDDSDSWDYTDHLVEVFESFDVDDNRLISVDEWLSGLGMNEEDPHEGPHEEHEGAIPIAAYIAYARTHMPNQTPCPTLPAPHS